MFLLNDHIFVDFQMKNRSICDPEEDDDPEEALDPLEVADDVLFALSLSMEETEVSESEEDEVEVEEVEDFLLLREATLILVTDFETLGVSRNPHLGQMDFS